MFWGEGNHSKLFIMDYDFELKKNSYSTNSYIEVLNTMLPKNYNNNLYFMQDNAPIYTVDKVKK
jgi:hypothetical protein